jgi:hypothetical protein
VTVTPPGVAAHLIIGGREEPFLPALLASLEGVADLLLVNDNRDDAPSVNADVLATSSFARANRMIVDRAPFVNFADARNRVLALHREHASGMWAAFVDADDVHAPVARRIARNLAQLPPEIAVVDAYTRHFLQSFRWYTSIERRMAFFRVMPDLRWEGVVHERLAGVAGRALAIPYVYDHFGWVMPLERLAAKGRQYASLGQSGKTYTAEEAGALDPRVYFARRWKNALRYHGTLPPAVTDVRDRFAYLDDTRTDAMIADLQPPGTRLANLVRRTNFEYRWRGRALDPRARALMR